MRLMTFAIAIWFAGCHNSDPAAPAEGPLTKQPSDAAIIAAVDAVIPDAMPSLDPVREAFWKRFIGDRPGSPGPEAMAWCRKHRKKHRDDVINRRTVEPDLELSYSYLISKCSLSAYYNERQGSKRLLVREFDTLVTRWGAPEETSSSSESRERSDTSKWIDSEDHLTAVVIRQYGAGQWKDRLEMVRVFWTLHAELESILGAPNQLIRGIDVESVVGAAPEALRRVIRPPYEMDTGTCEYVCSATGPGPPGGEQVRILSAVKKGRHGVLVDFGISDRDLARAMELITQSLGPVDDTATKAAIAAGTARRGDKIYRRAGILYLVSRISTRVQIDLLSDR